MAQGFKNKDGSKLGFRKGNTPWNKNKKCPQISDRLKGLIPWNKGGTSWSKGKKFSKTHKENLSKSNKGKSRGKGEKNPNWKGGITPENVKIRTSIETRLWREAVFARDSWTCQKTKIRGGKLHPHHIQNFAQYPELRFAIDNGITLSEKAHKEFHKKYGRKNNTLEQLNEFLKI